MIEISILPALKELFIVGGVITLILAIAVGYAWFNFRISHKPYYPLFTIAIAAASAGILSAFGAPTMPMLFFVTFFLLLGVYYRYVLKGRYRTPVYFMAPAAIGILLLFIYPLVYEFFLSYRELNLKNFVEWINTGYAPLADTYGLQNYIDVFKERATGQSFLHVFWRTMVWTVVNVFFHVTLGLALAMLLNTKGLRGVGLYRAILTLPWVIPQVIVVLIWRSDFNESVGFINQFIQVVNQIVAWEWNGQLVQPLTWLGFTTKAWFLDPTALFTASCIVNIWLGVPFMMVNSLGALQSIPVSVYEAANIDGASKIQQFFKITIPLLKPVMVPAVLLGGIWTFNNLNVIYLMTDGGRYEGADILVTDLYKQSFTYYRYGFAAAYSFVIFAILCVFTWGQLKISKSQLAET
jgi:arabinogalactan oligomer/maltooligosaccharide transport system permease protein